MFKEIFEAMKGLNNYALFTSYGISYLYNADTELSEALESYNVEGMESKIMFVFGIKEDKHMDAIWARKGFGPLAYMVAMEMQGEMAPYWNANQVTKAAENVWKEFFNGKGSKLVKATIMAPGMDESNYRNYNYSLRKKLNLSKNKKINKDFIGKDKFGEKHGMMIEIAESVLRQSMRGIYNF
jgi:hypothetical protein